MKGGNRGLVLTDVRNATMCSGNSYTSVANATSWLVGGVGLTAFEGKLELVIEQGRSRSWRLDIYV
jgi:hypothetical protein